MNATEISTEPRDSLNERQRAFVLEYIASKNATQSYIKAGYAARGNAASVSASQLLRVPQVAAAVAAAEAESLTAMQRRNGITLERTVVEIAKGAFYDVRNLFSADGSPKAISELDDATAAAIEGIDIVEQYAGSGDERVFVGVIKKYRLAKRTTSLDMLMKHLNGYKAENDSKGAATASALLTLLGDMRRSSLPIVQEVGNDHGV